MIETNKIKVYLILHPTKDDVFLKWYDSNFISWSHDILESKNFFNGSTAKSYITKISKEHKYIPRLLEIIGGDYQIIDQEERVKKSILDKEMSELNRQKVQQEANKRRLEQELEQIQKRLYLISQNSHTNTFN